MQHPDVYSVPILVPVEDDLLHSEAYPFCALDPTCGCHEDPLLIAEVANAVNEGLLTPDEATDFVAGKMLSWEDKS